MVAEQRFTQFHDVFWWSRRWNEEAATLESFDQRRRKRDTCVVLDFSPRVTQRETHFDTSETTD